MIEMTLPMQTAWSHRSGRIKLATSCKVQLNNGRKKYIRIKIVATLLLLLISCIVVPVLLQYNVQCNTELVYRSTCIDDSIAFKLDNCSNNTSWSFCKALSTKIHSCSLGAVLCCNPRSQEELLTLIFTQMKIGSIKSTGNINNKAMTVPLSLH